MVDGDYTRARTALLFVDPYNDFLSDGGKLWPLVEGALRRSGCSTIYEPSPRRSGRPVFRSPSCRIGRWEPSDYESGASSRGIPLEARGTNSARCF
jgi:hypothetical protein